jgi:hypothetical protein
MLMNSEWKLDTLRRLISSRESESISLEFKRSASIENTDPKKNEISKDVSAFANSGGGTIIYGMEENGHIATRLDNGVDTTACSKEWLEDVITSRIHRKIDGIKIWPIKVPRSVNHYYFVVDVPQSLRAPHQAFDKKFYKRYNFKAEPMEEYEIRDLALRGSAPDLFIDFSTSTHTSQLDQPQPRTSFKLAPHISNDAIEVAEYASINICIDARLQVINRDRSFDEHEDVFLIIAGSRLRVNNYQLNWAIPAKMPIFTGVNYKVAAEPFEVAISNNDTDVNYLIYAEVLAPKMDKKTYFYILHVNNGNPSLSHEAIDQENVIRDYDLPLMES